MTTNTAIKEIPLNQLTPWEGNVRKTQSKAKIDELAASIKAHGLLQSLVVIKSGKKFSVIAGNRRLAALTELQKAGAIDADYQVPCQVAEGAVDAMEISLAENAIRENMHPTDECQAYKDLVDKGAPLADIAARFGKTEQYVLQRLKLAKLSSQVIKAYRDGKLTLEHVQAFAVTDDHKLQNKVLSDFDPEYEDADSIRQQLIRDEVSADDRRVRFVTLKSYEKAGGAVRRDLFSTDNENIIILDVKLLDKLVDEKLTKSKAAVENEGWKWVEARTEFDYRAKAKFTALEEVLSPLSAKDAAKLKKLEAEQEKLDDEWMSSDQEGEYPERLNEIDQEIDEINEARKSSWTPEQLAIAGAVVTIGYNGKSEITRGLVKPEDKSKVKGLKTPAASDDEEEGKPAEKPEFSAGLIEDLTAERSVALAACLVSEPGRAFSAVVYTMVLDAFDDTYHSYGDNCLTIRTSDCMPLRMQETKAYKAIEQARKKWLKVIPKKPKALWTWCQEQDAETLMNLMAFCAATSVNAIQKKSDTSDSGRLVNADQLAKAVKLDMTQWFTPTAENYFGRVSKQQIVDALKEIGKGNLLDNAKTTKGDAASFAEGQAKESGWLPAILRAPKGKV